MKKVGLYLVLLTFVFAGRAQNALNFDGVNDFVQTNFSGVLGTSPRTVEAWVNAPFGLGTDPICGWGGPLQSFTFALHDGYLRISNGPSAFNSNALIGDSSWHHVAVTFNDSLFNKYNLYVDGKLVLNFNLYLSTSTTNAAKMFIGRRVDTAFYWKGVIDELRVWDYDRTGSQIAANMNRELCLAEPGLVAYYKFNQGIAGGSNPNVDTLFDYADSTHKGVLVNFAGTGSHSNWVSGKALTVGSFTDTSSYALCHGDSIRVGNRFYKTAGNYFDTLSTVYGCDSMVNFDITVYPPLDLTVTTIGSTIVSNALNATYQWIECQLGISIPSQTGSSFTATSNGSYAVIVTQNGCSDTSACVEISGLSTIESHFGDDWTYYPNPVVDHFWIDMGQTYDNVSMVIRNRQGQVTAEHQWSAASKLNAPIKGAGGVYFVEVRTAQGAVKVIRILKE